MSFRAQAYVADFSAARRIAKAVQWVIADSIGKETGVAEVSLEYLADETGWSKPTVLGAVNELRELGEVEVVREGGRGRGRMNVYRFPHMDQLGRTGKRSASYLFQPSEQPATQSGDGAPAGDDPQTSSFPQASSPQAGKGKEKVGKRKADETTPLYPKTDFLPARAREKGNGQSSTAPPSPGYRHDDNVGHDPDPNDCRACGTATADHRGKPGVPEQTKRGWRDALDVPWPDGPALPPPLDPEEERKRALAELANLEHPDAFPKTPPATRKEARHAT